MMKLLYGLLVLKLALYRGALGDPRPDFGIDGQVAGSATVQTIAVSAGVSFGEIDLKTISLQTHYTRLYDLKDQLTTIGTDIATTGQQLTGLLQTLALSTGPLPNVFNDVSGALDTLKTLLQTGLSTQTDAIKTMVGTYITDMLTDATGRLLNTLGQIDLDLGLVQAAINNAITGYGSSIVPAEIVRRYVSPRLIYELQRDLHDLNSDLPLVTYIIELTLGHLESADLYLSTVMEHAMTTVYDVIMLYDGFQREIVDASYSVSDSIATPIRINYEDQLNSLAFAMADLEQMDSYATALGPALSAYESALGSDNRDSVALGSETIIDTYLQNVVTLDDYIDRFYDEKLCAPVQAILQVLIASGPWADYCFSKYSPRLNELVDINANRFLMCYEIEADRLQTLYDLVDRLVQQIIFDVMDLSDNVLQCLYRQERGSECIAMIGPHYIDLGNNLAKKMTDLTNIIDYETNASYQRMAACDNAGKCDLIASAEEIVTEAQACELHGPNA